MSSGLRLPETSFLLRPKPPQPQQRGVSSHKHAWVSTNPAVLMNRESRNKWPGRDRKWQSSLTLPGKDAPWGCSPRPERRTSTQSLNFMNLGVSPSSSWHLPKSRSGPSSMCPASRERTVRSCVSAGLAGCRTDTHNTSYYQPPCDGAGQAQADPHCTEQQQCTFTWRWGC